MRISLSLNRNLLDSTFIKSEQTTEIKAYIECNTTQDTKVPFVWDTLKATLSGVLISKATFLKQLREDEYNTLHAKTRRLEKDHKETGDNSIYASLMQGCKKLEMLEIEKVKKNSFS